MTDTLREQGEDVPSPVGAEGLASRVERMRSSTESVSILASAFDSMNSALSL